MNIGDPTLRLFLVDALEPGPAQAVRTALQSSPRLRRRLAQLEAQGWPPALPTPDPWRVPPPGLGWPGGATSAGVLSGGVRVGEVCRIGLAPPTSPAESEVVLLCRIGDGGWEVVSPRHPDERTRTDLLEVEGERICVDFLARPPAGPQRWAAALVPSALLDTLDLAATDWAPLQAALAAGLIPLTSMDIVVEQG